MQYHLVIEPSPNTLDTYLWRVDQITGEKKLVQKSDSLQVAKTKKRIEARQIWSRNCPVCGKEFVPITGFSWTCSYACQRKRADKKSMLAAKNKKEREMRAKSTEYDHIKPISWEEKKELTFVLCVCNYCLAHYTEIELTRICDDCIHKAAKKLMAERKQK